MKFVWGFVAGAIVASALLLTVYFVFDQRDGRYQIKTLPVTASQRTVQEIMAGDEAKRTVIFDTRTGEMKPIN